MVAVPDRQYLIPQDYLGWEERIAFQITSPSAPTPLPRTGTMPQPTSYRLKLVDRVNGQPPLRLYQSHFELQRETQARGRGMFIRWYCDRLRSILDTHIALLVNRVGRYRVDLGIIGTQGQREIVRTGWIVEADSDAAKLVTLYVRRRQ